MSQGQIELTDIHWLMDILQNIDVGLVVLDTNYNIHLWNAFMDSHSGISPQVAKDKNLFDLFPEVPEDWFRKKAEPVFQLKTRTFTIWEQRPYLFKFSNSRPITGRTEFMYQNTSIIPLESPDKQVNHICLIIYDVTDTAVGRIDVTQAQETLSEIQSHDALTGLLNRSNWLAVLDQVYTEQTQGAAPSSLLIIDLDHFRLINREIGHDKGDEILKRLGAALKTLGGETHGARLGGELFGLILKGKNAEQAVLTAERLRRSLSTLNKSTQNNNGSTMISASIGVATWHASITSASEWLSCADKALYHAKESGKNRTTLYQHKN